MVEYDISYKKIRSICTILIGFQISSAIIQFVYHHFFAVWIKKPLKFEELGQWAVIAGATNGLGRAFAEEFASRGMCIVLLDFDEKEGDLTYLAKDIEDRYHVKTLSIASSLQPKTVIFRKIHTQIVNLEIGVVVVNLHVLQSRPEWFIDGDETDMEIERVITGNIHATTWLLRTLLPPMADRGSGLLLLVSSFTVLFPTPMLVPTSACKAYCASLARTLAAELRGRVCVRLLLPGLLQCQWLRLRAPSLLAPSPAQYLRTALPLVARHERTTGYWVHDILAGIVRGLNFVCPRLANEVMVKCMGLVREVSIRGYLEE